MRHSHDRKHHTNNDVHQNGNDHQRNNPHLDSLQTQHTQTLHHAELPVEVSHQTNDRYHIDPAHETHREIIPLETVYQADQQHLEQVQIHQTIPVEDNHFCSVVRLDGMDQKMMMTTNNHHYQQPDDYWVCVDYPEGDYSNHHDSMDAAASLDQAHHNNNHGNSSHNVG